MAQLDSIRLSGTTYELVDSTAVHSLDGYLNSGETIAAITAATNALAESIAEQGYQTSGDVQNAIDEAVSGKADSSDVETLSGAVTAHTSDTDIHVTTSDKQTWNAKADLSDIPSVSGYADSVAYNSTSKYVEFYHGGTGGTLVFSYDASPFIIDGMVQNVEIKDVTISGESVTCLVISFNTDAGKQDINIPISEIFDASNYYDKTAIDGIVSGLTQRIAEDEETTSYALNVLDENKQDVLLAGTGISISNNVISVTGVPLTIDDTVTSGSSNAVKSSGIYNFVTGETSTKQDELVSGTNIKTINNTSILGSGDLTITGGLQAEVSGSTLILS